MSSIILAELILTAPFLALAAILGAAETVKIVIQIRREGRQ